MEKLATPPLVQSFHVDQWDDLLKQEQKENNKQIAPSTLKQSQIRGARPSQQSKQQIKLVLVALQKQKQN